MSSGMWHNVGLVRTDILEERVTSVLRVERTTTVHSFIYLFAIDPLRSYTSLDMVTITTM
jgi:hypothetical protein